MYPAVIEESNMRLLYTILVCFVSIVFAKGDANELRGRVLALESTMEQKWSLVEKRLDIISERLEQLSNDEMESKVDKEISRIDKQLKELNDKHDRFLHNATEPVAFSVYRDTRELYEPVQTVIFPAARVNLGDHYNHDTGIFTCPVAGYYYFAFGSYNQAGGSIALQLVRDGVPTTASWSDAANYDQGFMSVIIPCFAGDEVWLRNGATVNTYVGELTYYGSCISNSFSGFLLYELSYVNA